MSAALTFSWSPPLEPPLPDRCKVATKTWVRMGSIVSPNSEENKDKSWAWEAFRKWAVGMTMECLPSGYRASVSVLHTSTGESFEVQNLYSSTDAPF